MYKYMGWLDVWSAVFPADVDGAPEIVLNFLLTPECVAHFIDNIAYYKAPTHTPPSFLKLLAQKTLF